jgi:hypothetical protein
VRRHKIAPGQTRPYKSTTQPAVDASRDYILIAEAEGCGNDRRR